MIQQPMLIRRPLLQAGSRRRCGFDLAAIDAWLGLAPRTDLSADVQTCPATAR